MTTMKGPLWIMLSFAVVSIQMMFQSNTVEGTPFCYDDNRQDCHGPDDWDDVDGNEYYWNWDRFFHKSFRSNDCDKTERQSPINLDRSHNNCDLEKDDKHRQVLKHGTCEWHQLNWNIRPFGLEMSLPMPSHDDVNPERDPCTKPNFDSSGGYGDSFFMNYMLVKTPAEHTFEGKSFDGEIQMAFFRYNGDNPKVYGGPPYTVHILLEALEDNVDNYMLQPYLDEWQARHDLTMDQCIEKYDDHPDYRLYTNAPTISPAPSMSLSPTSSPTCRKYVVQKMQLNTLYQNDDVAQIERTNGIVFDIENRSTDRSMYISSLDLNVKRVTDEPQVFRVYRRLLSWRYMDDGTLWDGDDFSTSTLRRSDMWYPVSSSSVTYGHSFQVRAKDKFESTRLDLSHYPIRVLPGETMALYIVQMTNADLYSVYHGKDGREGDSIPLEVGVTAVTSQDGVLAIKVGQAITLGDQDAAELKELRPLLHPFLIPRNRFGGSGSTLDGPVSFNGRINYHMGRTPDEEECLNKHIDQERGDGDEFYYYDKDERFFRRRHQRRRQLLRFASSSLGKSLDGSIQSPDDTNNTTRRTLSLSNYDESLEQRRGEEETAEEDDSNRRLDHTFIDKWYDGEAKDPKYLSNAPPDQAHFRPYWDVFRLWTSPWFVRYRGSLTMPQCFDDTRVRVLDRALQISFRQKEQIDKLIAQMRHPLGHRQECQLGTVGKPRTDGTNFVDVNRPLFEVTKDHDMKYCDDTDFSQNEFFRTSRGNTCWCLMQGTCPHGCHIDCAGNCRRRTSIDSKGRSITLDNNSTVQMYCDEHWATKDLGTWDVHKCRKNGVFGIDDED